LTPTENDGNITCFITQKVTLTMIVILKLMVITTGQMPKLSDKTAHRL